MTENAYVGEIRLFAGPFAPVGWSYCHGQVLSASQYPALYAILGNAYGGDQQSFALPDLRGRVPVSFGSTPGQPGLPVELGEQGGSETVTLTQAELPSHRHTISLPNARLFAAATQGSLHQPAQDSVLAQGFFQGASAHEVESYATSGTSVDTTIGGVSADPLTFDQAGNQEAHSNMQPSIAIDFIIALEGVFPPHS